MTESAFSARLRLLAQLRDACRRRAAEPSLELFHYIVQLYRGYSDKSEEGFNVAPQRDKLCRMAASLGRTDPDFVWQSIDELLHEFPWQQDGYVEFTEIEQWQSRFSRNTRLERHRFVEIDPSNPGKLKPFQPDSRKLWLVMGGNRTHINGIEWQDPTILHEPLIKHAEAAMWRFLSSMNRVLRPVLGDDYAIVGIAPSAIRSRWEARLENFKVTRFPTWSHPRHQLLARDIVEQFGERTLLRETGSVLSAYSLGCAAAEQLMNASAAISAAVSPNAWSNSVYFAGYVGIRSDLGPRRRLQVVSLTDEAVFGSPDMPSGFEEATASQWFSSPLTLRPSPWEDAPPGFDDVIANHDSGCGWSSTRQVNEHTRLIILAGQCSIPSDKEGNAQLDHDTRMVRTRFGHFLDATLNQFAATSAVHNILMDERI